MTANAGTPHVLVIGGGFGGLTLTRELARAPVRVTLVDRCNHHLFQPLLYQVATAGLSPADIARPLRQVVHRQKNASVLMAEVARVDPEARRVVLTSGEQIDFDYCAVAVGARHSYFGNASWEPAAPGLKTLADALEIRGRTLRAFERAERQALLGGEAEPPTFVVVGGGPTGVEMAGAIAEIAHHTMRRNFRRLAPGRSRVVLLEAEDSLLTGYPADLREAARRQLEELRVEVRLGTKVVHLDEQGATFVTAGDGDHKEHIATRNVVWAAGNEVSNLVRDLGVEVDRSGRAVVESDLSIAGHRNVFVIGDAARVGGEQPVPAVAPAAMQQGRAVASSIRADLRGRGRRDFAYRDKGSMATVGRLRAVAWIGKLRLSGLVAWLAWSLVHILFLIGFRNRLVVMFQWILLYFTSQRSSRLLYDRSTTMRTSLSDPREEDA